MESFKTIIGLAIIFLSQQACAEHMNQRESIPTPEEMEERGVAARASSIEKFNTYVEQDKASKKAGEAVSSKSSVDCSHAYPEEPACLQQIYKAGEYYVVKVYYRQEPNIPRQPRSYRIPGSDKRDTQERDDFLAAWSDRVLSTYLGQNYHKYNFAKLDQIFSQTVGITVHILSASELEEILSDSRVVRHEHIANPAVPDELVMP